ncbi:MAG: undecaprenyl diphosphate synthase family protein, partial [Methanosarcinales archaeon]|nr:undecaprenyl diphosphate synthase family protein [Methanosarcinales archaeon]
MLQRIYERTYEYRLHYRVVRHNMPAGLTLVMTESDISTPAGIEKLRSFVLWCADLGIKSLIVYIAVTIYDDLKDDVISQIVDRLDKTDLIAMMYVRDDSGARMISTMDSSEDAGGGEGVDKEVMNMDCGVKLDISIGYGGKLELTDAIKDILKKVESGETDLNDINTDMIESHLVFKHKPDLVIRAGGKSLTDFLIWQTIYSELYFTDVNFAEIRRLDFLRV